MSFLTVDQVLNNIYVPESGSLKTFYSVDEVLNGVYDETSNALKINISGNLPVSGTIKNITDVTSAEISTNTDTIYVLETETFYRYILNGSSYIRNGFSILNTGNGGNSRFIGISGKYTEILNYEQLSTKELTGIPTEELPKFTIDYSPSTRILTLTHISDYKVFIHGKLFVKASNISITAHNNTTGLYYYYFDIDGELKMSMTFPDVFNDVAFVTYIYYNAELIDGFAGEERHGVKMDGNTHKLLHYSFGTQYKSGFEISGYTLKSDNISNTVYNITSGNIYDEDILLNIPAVIQDSNYTIFYKSGSLDDWYWTDNQSLPYLISNNNIQYNEYSGSIWRVKELNENKFFNSYVCATDSIDLRFQTIIVLGQHLYDTQSECESGGFNDLNLTGFPFTETLPIYQIIHNYNTYFSITTGKSRFESVIKLYNEKQISNNNWSIDKIKKYVDNKVDVNIVTVAKNGGQYLTICDAMESITDASITNPYLISVGPGIYNESEINVKSYVSIAGSSINSTIVQPVSGSNHHVFVLNEMTDVSFLTVKNANSGYAGFYCENIGRFAILHKISIYDCDYGIQYITNNTNSQLYLEYVDINGEYTEAINTVATSGHDGFINVENTYIFGSSNTSSNQIRIDGTVYLTTMVCEVFGNGNDTGILVTNGGTLKCRATVVSDCNIGIYADTNGNFPSLRLGGVSFSNNTTYDFKIENANATGFYTGDIEYLKKVLTLLIHFIY
jgi:hypothetical protein